MAAHEDAEVVEVLDGPTSIVREGALRLRGATS